MCSHYSMYTIIILYKKYYRQQKMSPIPSIETYTLVGIFTQPGKCSANGLCCRRVLLHVYCYSNVGNLLSRYHCLLTHVTTTQMITRTTVSETVHRKTTTPRTICWTTASSAPSLNTPTRITSNIRRHATLPISNASLVNSRQRAILNVNYF